MNEQEFIALVTGYGDERARIIIAGNWNLPRDRNTEKAQALFDLIAAEVRRLNADNARLKAINKELTDWWDATNPWRDDDIEGGEK